MPNPVPTESTMDPVDRLLGACGTLIHKMLSLCGLPNAVVVAADLGFGGDKMRWDPGRPVPAGKGRHRQAPGPSPCCLSVLRNCRSARPRVGPIAPRGIPATRATSV